MRIVIHRVKHDINQTTGILTVLNKNGWPVFVCPCIERGWRDNKKNVSSVPAGTYKLVREWSPRFQRDLYELKGVPGRSECKIHSANFWYQLNGCISPGSYLKELNGDKYQDVAASKRALNDLHRVLNGVEETTISIRNSNINYAK